MIRALAVGLAWVFGLARSAAAHKASDRYLDLVVDGAGASGQWDIALRDLEQAVGLDADGYGAATWGELKARRTSGFFDPPITLPRTPLCGRGLWDHAQPIAVSPGEGRCGRSGVLAWRCLQRWPHRPLRNCRSISS